MEREHDPKYREENVMRFAKRLALALVLVSLLPVLIGLLGRGVGAEYFGFHQAFDDHMVYAAWMHQAASGEILFDNRFTLMEQPGLTFHLYFLVLGWVSVVLGIPVAAILARAVFTGLFVILLARLLLKLDMKIYTSKFAIFLASVGGGLGWFIWRPFKVGIDPEVNPLAYTLLAGELPIDVWQTEALGFASMLSNGLFMASLCLILVTFISVIEARHSWKPVFGGFLAFGVLMNIHSYDALLIALILVGFAVACLVARQAQPVWILRAVVVGLGALPAAGWFLYVLSVDPVFQARAATETFSPPFRAVAVALFPAILLGLAAIFRNRKLALWRRLTACGALVVLYGWLYAISAPGAYEGFLLSPVSFGVALGLVLVVLGLLALPDLDWNLFWAWALVGSVAIYFPALFQRKLAMGLFIAWGVVAAFGLASLIRKMERSPRNMVSALAILVFSASSILWLQREVFYLRENVSSTTVHSVYYGADVGEILALLNEEENVSAIAMPGVANSVSATVFTSPYLPDLNALLSGMAGAYTYAGHWSETPDYLAKRNEATAFFLEGQGVPSAVDGVRPATREAWRGLFLAHHGIDYIVAPVPATFPELRLADLETYGEIVYSGTQFKLIRVD